MVVARRLEHCLFGRANDALGMDKADMAWVCFCLARLFSSIDRLAYIGSLYGVRFSARRRLYETSALMRGI